MGKNDQNSHENPLKAIKPVVTFFSMRQKKFTSAGISGGCKQNLHCSKKYYNLNYTKMTKMPCK
jgi:hypothetical protein